MDNITSFSEITTKSGGYQNAVIKVLGIGGGGNNTVAHMQAHGIEGVEFVCANTDAQALRSLQNCTILQLGEQMTRGLGSGANPEVGRQAAEIDRERIRALLEGVDMIFITAGEGGGTGSGATPVFAEIASQLGILTVAIVTKPFAFEGKRRLAVAEEGVKQLSKFVDALITIPNNKLMRVLGKQVSLLDAFKAVNNVLLGAAQGIAELITRPGLINVDFADVRTVMSEMGTSMMGTGEATGEGRAKVAAKAAIANPLLEDIHLSDAKGVLVNITAGLSLSIGEFEEVGEVVKEFTAEGANVVIGTVIDPTMEERLRVTIVLTGLGSSGGTNKKSAEAKLSPERVGEQLFDRPAILRKKSSEQYSGGGDAGENHYLDVLNFVRREKVRSEDD